jgi:hypothetical protein
MRRETVKRQRELEAQGWALKSEYINTIRPHTGQVTPKHWHAKAELCRIVANQEGNSFYTEAPLGDTSVDADKADVLLFRESTHENAIVVEFESNVDEEQKIAKVETYLTPNIQDVLVLDPQEAPDELSELENWIEVNLKGFL